LLIVLAAEEVSKKLKHVPPSKLKQISQFMYLKKKYLILEEF